MINDEIVSVIAHEVGHYKLKHIYSGIFLSAIQSGIMLYVMSLFLENRALFDVFYMEYTSIYASLVFFSMLYAPISLLLGIFFTYISRPDTNVIYVYPTPENEQKILYKDKADNCFKFQAQEITCPADISQIKNYKIQ